ncbi:MAG: PAS domain S-box protein, partial [Proteobacteria bacterium]|nr:PAS domain S-box protein [Pseudomonadota bacterium]
GTAREEILILNSYHPGFAWSDDEQAGIIDVFRRKDKNWLPVIEYLDLKRLPDGKHLAELKKLFRQKYQNKKFSVVIAMDNPALEFAIDNQAELFGNAPIVFCGINNYTSSLLKGRSDVTGIAESLDIAGTIEVMLRLHPATQEIFSPHDYTASGLAVRKELEALVPRFGAKVRFRFTDPLTMEELLKELERLPKNSLVLEISFITDKSGRTFGVSETTKLFYEHSPVPIYSTYEQRLGFGIVGGKLLSPRIHGVNAARIALRVLAGEKASAIPVVFESDSQFMFDYTVMSRFGIPLSALPKGSIVINKPVSFYAAHRVVIQTALGIIGILIIVISLLTVIIIQRRRSAIVLRTSEAKYYDLYENAPDMYFSVDVKTANITECNNTLVNTIGYAKEDIVGRSVFEIYHPDCSEDAKRAFQQFVATGEVRDAELTIMRKDGSIIVVSLNASAIRDNKGNIIHRRSVWRDITERKKAENALRGAEENFRLSLDDSPLGVRIVTKEGETIYANRAILDIYGYESIDELKTTPLKKRYTPESYAEFQIRWEKRKQGDYDPSEYEISIVRKDGEVRHLHVFRKEILWDGERQFQVIYQDITERKRISEEFRRLANRSRDGIYRYDLTTRQFVFVNNAYLEFFGIDAEGGREVTTKSVLLAIYPEDRDKVKKARNESLAPGSTGGDVEYRQIRPDGSLHWMHDRWIVIKDETGNPVMIEGIIRDNTERKRAEEERERLLAEIAAKNQELESFVYTVSHDLRAPLVSLDGFTSLLKRESQDQLGEQGQHYLERIGANVAHMNTLITELLELSRIGRVVGPEEEIDAGVLLREIEGGLVLKLEQEGVEFIVQQPLPAVRGDRGRIRQV